MARRFRKGFFGYNPVDVDGWLERIAADQRAREGEIAAELTRLKGRQGEAAGEGEALRAALTAAARSAALVELALEQAQSAGELLTDHARIRGRKLHQQAAARASEYRALIPHILDSIAALKREIESFFAATAALGRERLQIPEPAPDVEVAGKVAGTILQPKDKASYFITDAGDGLLKIKPGLQGRLITTKSGAQVGVIGQLIFDKQQGVIAGYEIERSLLPDVPRGSIIPAGEVLALKKEGIIVGDAFIKSLSARTRQAKPAREEARAEESGAEDALPPASPAAAAPAAAGLKADSEPSPAPVADQEASPEDQARPLSLAAEPAMPAPAPGFTARQDHGDMATQIEAFIDAARQITRPAASPEEPQALPPRPAQPAAALPQAEVAAASAAPAEPQKAPQRNSAEGIKRAVEKHRMSYVVGKIAGASLADEKGEAIVAEGQVITPEVVARADAAGKLADLIINMRIPGLEAEEEAL